MGDTDSQTSSGNPVPTPAALSSAKKEKKTKNPRIKPSHPPTSEMVNNAIKGLKERGGSSLQAIKKYISANYKVDAEKVAPFIKKYLKGAVAGGSLVQTKGKGASGSFKLAATVSGASKPASGDKKKTTVVRRKKTTKIGSAGKSPVAKTKGVKKAIAASPRVKKLGAEKKKATRPRKTSAATKKPASATTASSASTATPRGGSKLKSPSKAKKSNKAGPTKKPRVPKPKTSKAAATTKAKKAASPKRKK